MSSWPPPASAARALKGEAATLTSSDLRVCQMARPSRKVGSSRSPSTGTSSRMTPSLSVRMASTSWTGSEVASVLPVGSPRVNWSRRTTLPARSLPLLHLPGELEVELPLLDQVAEVLPGVAGRAA